MPATKTKNDETDQNTPAVTPTQRYLSLLVCTQLSALLTIALSLARIRLGIDAWPWMQGYLALCPFYAAITVTSLTTYRWLVGTRGVDLHVHLFVSMGAPGLVTYWSFSEGFARVFGVGRC